MQQIRNQSGFGLFHAASAMAIVLAAAAALAVAAPTCYCDIGLGSACRGAPLNPCGGAGAGCSEETAGSDQIYMTSSQVAVGFDKINLGAMGNCLYNTGTCSYSVPGKCVDDHTGPHSLKVQSSTPTGNACATGCN